MTEPMTLLPCPFCGGEAEIVRAMDKDGRFAAVGCPACGAGSRQHYFVGDDAVPHVVSAWNCRAHLAQQAQQEQPMTLEPNGGNLYRPHKMMITSGEFWRCAHGMTGLDGVECPACQSHLTRAIGTAQEGWMVPDGIRHFVEMYDAKPMRGLHDVIYAIHTGTEHEAELRMSDLRALLPTPPTDGEG